MTIVEPVTTEVSQTGQQSVAVSKGGLLEIAMPATYEAYREMRRHPTIALVRALSVAPAVAGAWSTKADDAATEGMVLLVEKELFPLRPQIIRQTLTNRIDYGWAPYEIVYAARPDGKLGVVKLKPLLHEITTIRVEEATGAFAGFEQGDATLPLAYCFLVSWDAEGTYWYGASLLENIRNAYDDWVASNEGATRYDAKMAGAHWVVHYPEGKGLLDGVLVKNFEIARDVLRALEASGGVVIPSSVQTRLDEMDAEGKGEWKIELLSDAPKQYSFANRLGYLDKLMVRGVLMPERSILEGTYGTKAEAAEHKSAALTNLELAAMFVTDEVNRQIVDPLLTANFGPKAAGLVRLESAPILDEKLAFLRELTGALVKDPVGFVDLFAMVDTTALFDRLGIPRLPEGEAGKASADKRDLARMIKEMSDGGG